MTRSDEADDDFLFSTAALNAVESLRAQVAEERAARLKAEAERDAASADFRRLRDERDQARAAFVKWTRGKANSAEFHNTGGGSEPDCPMANYTELLDDACTCGLADLSRLLGEAP